MTSTRLAIGVTTRDRWDDLRTTRQYARWRALPWVPQTLTNPAK